VGRLAGSSRLSVVAQGRRRVEPRRRPAFLIFLARDLFVSLEQSALARIVCTADTMHPRAAVRQVLCSRRVIVGRRRGYVNGISVNEIGRAHEVTVGSPHGFNRPGFHPLRPLALNGGDGTPAHMPLPIGAVASRSVSTIPELHRLVRRAFQLSRILPDELLNNFEQATAALPRTIEIERLVVERVGQDIFRNGLLEYWQGRCALTGLAVPELLRASHIKPWPLCDSDAERLDIFNGLLLAPNLDAAFDCGLITLANDGLIILSARLDPAARSAIGVDMSLRANHLTSAHQVYLAFHRAHKFRDR